MRKASVVMAAIAVAATVPSTAQAAVELRFTSTASAATGQYAEQHETCQEARARYRVSAKVPLKKRAGRGWVGSGKIVFRSWDYTGRGGGSPLKATGARSGTFRVRRLKLRVRNGKVADVALKVDPGFPALRILNTRRRAGAGGECTPKTWWNGRDTLHGSPAPGWRAMFDCRHGAAYQRFVNGMCAPPPFKPVTVKDWRGRAAGGRVLATKSYNSGLPQPDGYAILIYKEKWRLLRTRS